ncbi:hypothetical protein F5051DRAFT_425976 [Lentinula edodes]|nr:hypothetical protein F5051DRAFT_425976 [Lentinula edodes]
MVGYMIATVHALPASLSSRSLRFTSQTNNTAEAKWLIQTPYPKLEAKDRKAFAVVESRKILLSTAEHDSQIPPPKDQKTPIDSHYAKVKMLREIDEYVDSGKVQGRGGNLAFIMNGNSTDDISSVPLEKVNLSNAQKKQVKGQIGKLVCRKVVEVAGKHQILYMFRDLLDRSVDCASVSCLSLLLRGFEATDILVALSDRSAHLTSRSILSSSSDSTPSPMVKSVDVLGWDEVKKIIKDVRRMKCILYRSHLHGL